MVSQTLDVEALHPWMSRHYMGRMHLETVSIRKIASQQQVRTCMMAVQAAEVPVVAQHVLLFSSKLYGTVISEDMILAKAQNLDSKPVAPPCYVKSQAACR